MSDPAHIRTNRFAELPPGDRWHALDNALPELIARHVRASQVDPSDEIAVADLAKRHGVSIGRMLARLREFGGRPYALGSAWHIRRREYVRVLEGIETAPAVKPLRRRNPSTTAAP